MIQSTFKLFVRELKIVICKDWTKMCMCDIDFVWAVKLHVRVHVSMCMYDFVFIRVYDILIVLYLTTCRNIPFLYMRVLKANYLVNNIKWNIYSIIYNKKYLCRYFYTYLLKWMTRTKSINQILFSALKNIHNNK